MTSSSDRSDQIRKLRDMVRDIDYGMLTTIDADGSLHSRPMAVNSSIHPPQTISRTQLANLMRSDVMELLDRSVQARITIPILSISELINFQ
ncbi:MAG: pyridoxamine 5'-phosphate oxidase family protein [Leptolyngbyaceae cyanobacterium RM1_406_9]|nr:pyridoxamine 5'-phosphate oxidase family protein [Leptolyngbyaceae cyanobacterium RM1_406_9]